MVTFQRELFHSTAKWHLSATWEIILPDFKLIEYNTESSLGYEQNNKPFKSKMENHLTMCFDDKFAINKLSSVNVISKNLCVIIQNGKNKCMIHDFIPYSIIKKDDIENKRIQYTVQGLFDSYEEIIPSRN